MFDRTRKQGADLAHALKTPSAILRNELERFKEGGCDTKAALDALDRIDAQILRSLARLRAVNAAAIALPQTHVRPSVERLARLFRSLPEGRDTEFDFTVAKGHQVAMDHHDLEEVIGNLLENAFRWRRKTVHLSTALAADIVTIRIEDDGPGIDAENREEALRAGGRLDERPKGTGLGLAIARDLVEAYGGRLDLGWSERLGGLCVSLALPAKGSVSGRT
jgi:signal transduction histidine kinase